jgi:hypothetical protein
MSSVPDLVLLRSLILEGTTKMIDDIRLLQKSFLERQNRSIEHLFDEMNHVMTNFKSKCALVFENPFENLPEELLLHIFSYLDSNLEVASQVCKRFHGAIKNNQILWKTQCISWWISHKPKATGFTTNEWISSLEWIRDISLMFGKDWQWFAHCFRDRLRSHLDYRQIHLGSMHSQFALNGFGLSYDFAATKLHIGDFNDGELQGYGRMMIKTKGDCYEGTWKDGWHHEYGIYTWADGTR